MNSPIISITAASLLAATAFAAEPPAKDLDYQRAICDLEDHILQREARLTELSNDIIQLHQRVDGKMEALVKRLSGLKDSPKSGFRVGKLKSEVIEGLRKAADAYQSKRAEVIREIREGRSGIPKEALEGDAKHYDEHIEKHLEQILQISKSFTQDENVKKYERIGSGEYYSPGLGWDDDLYQITDEWRQNRRDRIMNKKQRDEAIGALKKSIERCESLIAGLKDNLQNNRLSKIDRELMQGELNRHIRMLDTRKGQLEELAVVPKTHTTPLSRDAARDLADALRSEVHDLQEDIQTIFYKHGQLNRERARVFKLERTLAARKMWIEEHPDGKE